MVKIKKVKNQKYLGLGKDFQSPIAVAQEHKAQELQGPFQMWSRESLDLGLFKPSYTILTISIMPSTGTLVRLLSSNPSTDLSYI